MRVRQDISSAIHSTGEDSVSWPHELSVNMAVIKFKKRNLGSNIVCVT